MSSSILQSCFICGLATFLANLMLSIAFSPVLILSACLLPGFVFGLVLLAHNERVATLPKTIFLLISSSLYVLVAWLPTGHNFAWQQKPYIFILASILGAVGLLLAYYLLLSRQLALKKGVLLVSLSGLLSALIPFATASATSELVSNWLGMAGVFSILFSWQTLFGWVLQIIDFQHNTLSNQPLSVAIPASPTTPRPA